VKRRLTDVDVGFVFPDAFTSRAGVVSELDDVHAVPRRPPFRVPTDHGDMLRAALERRVRGPQALVRSTVAVTVCRYGRYRLILRVSMRPP
jgi:hypothetical protein